MSAYTDAATEGMIIRLFKTEGRSSRADFWWLVVATWVFTGVAGIFTYLPYVNMVVCPLIMLWIAISLFTCSIRRFHDMNKSGAPAVIIWLVIAAGIPTALLVDQQIGSLMTLGGYLVLLAVMSIKGDLGTNSYGPVNVIAPLA